MIIDTSSSASTFIFEELDLDDITYQDLDGIEKDTAISVEDQTTEEKTNGDKDVKSVRDRFYLAP